MRAKRHSCEQEQRHTALLMEWKQATCDVCLALYSELAVYMLQLEPGQLQQHEHRHGSALLQLLYRPIFAVKAQVQTFIRVL